MVQSLRACPASSSSEVAEWLHETVRILHSSSTSLGHTFPTPAHQGSYTSADLGMHPAHASVQTRLSPLASIPPELVNDHGLVTTFFTHAVAKCFPIGASVDPAALRLLQRKYKPFAPCPIKEPRSSTWSAMGTSAGSTHHGRRPSRTQPRF